jgi:hypothetical protein
MGDPVAMVALVSRRLEAVFGTSLDALTEAHITALVSSHVQEAFDLDFKRDHYERNGDGKRKLAGDVAALANTAGGVILIGVDEDENACAIDAPGVELSDAATQWVLQVVGSLVTPFPSFDVVPIRENVQAANDSASPSTATRGFIAIAVARTLAGPHAVLVNEGFRFPRRNGTTTRYLSEPEVAAAYRERFLGFSDQTGRAAAIEEQAIARLERDVEPWLVVSLVPDVAGSFEIDPAAMRLVKDQTIGRHAAVINTGVTYRRVTLGRRRVLVDATMVSAPKAHRASLELHTNGCATYALQLHWLTGHGGTASPPPTSHLVDDEHLVVACLSGLLQTARHARDRAAAGGNAVIRVSLVQAVDIGRVELGYRRNGFADALGPFSVGGSPATAESVVSLEAIANPGVDLVSVAATLLNELAQPFGVVELGQLSRDGAVRRRYWGQAWQGDVVEWAEHNDVPVTDDVLSPY